MNNPPNSFLSRGGLWAAGQFLLMGANIGLGLGVRGDWPGRTAQVGGLVLFAVSALSFVAGLVALGRNLTPLPQPRPEGKLVRRGIYARVRHPLYTSVILMALGWALFWRSWPALLVALALIPFFHAKVRREERWLHERFPEYADYARRVPRFFPRRRPHPDLRCNF